MKQRAASRRRGARAIAVPTECSTDATPTSDGRPLPRQSVWRVSRTLPVVALILLVVLALTFTYTTSALNREVEQARRELESRDYSKLLAMQQLDAVFRELANDLMQKGDLAEADAGLLRTWLRFDEVSLAEHDGGQSRFEQAMVERRIGKCHLLLGENARAVKHLQHALSLFTELAADNQAVTNYIEQQAQTRVQLGLALQQAGDPEAAAEMFLQAAKTMENSVFQRDPGYLPHPDLHPLLLEVHYHNSLAQVATQQQDWSRVHTCRQRVVQVLQQLVTTFPESEHYQSTLGLAQELEAAAGRRVPDSAQPSPPASAM